MRPALLIIAGCLGLSSVSHAEPRPYSVERYQSIWQGKQVFVKVPRSLPSLSELGEWTVAGVFSFGPEEGAVIVNRASGAIEYLNTSTPSPSGLVLSRISFSHAGQAPSIEVVRNGRPVTLNGPAVGVSLANQEPIQYLPAKKPSQSSPVALARSR